MDPLNMGPGQNLPADAVPSGARFVATVDDFSLNVPVQENRNEESGFWPTVLKMPKKKYPN